MTRGACLLLLLSSWLLALPAVRLGQPSRELAVVASSFREASTAAAGEHLVSRAATLEVPHAPLLARLPVPHGVALIGSPEIAWAPIAPIGDRRDAMRRVQLRRRLPRLGGEEPPWS